MKKILLLFIPLLLISCGTKREECSFDIFNDTQTDLMFILYSPEDPPTKEYNLYEGSYWNFEGYPMNQEHKIMVRNKRLDEWTTFIFCPDMPYKQYYIYGTDTVFKMTASTVNGKSEKVKRIPPSE